MGTYAQAVYDQGRKRERDNWFKESLKFLIQIKREGKLGEIVWRCLEANCPDKDLMPKLRKAVGEA